ncbi:MAG TPA: delta-60 repeat domain-containing protein [Amaricoccus sp.]|uniref:delta-60 repeat domain-containing protein n=1 Tax=Amaricoccus sp. TaxID=1872485 RepID=UPI002CBCA700|nr:delta-60 repeat domain-containing protein [Amaricoccus sp.]HMR52823.1 delta-60 repeat domain-containing protein [Amaricoccus sp.]HMR60239.1 delta-60 repeat domain-containing protein [Amaricoccus sp.]HMT99758.1 delta-60 repeat domain-containing protein [Amaricoccus sp.]
MLTRCLLSTTALALAVPALAQDIQPVADTVTEVANDLRGVTFAADGKIYVSGFRGDDEVETTSIVGRFNADGTPDTGFGEDGFVELDLAPGRVEESMAVVELSGGDVVAAVNAIDEDGGESVYLLRFDSTGAQVTGDAWGGESGAVEVVFGWANADNGSFPGVEAPPQDSAWDLDVDASGDVEKLVVNGYGAAGPETGRTDNDRYVARLLASDGSNDPDFNGGMPFTYQSAQEFSDGGRRATVEPDGAILSAGYTNLGDTLRNHVILIRLNPDGTLDEGFGGFIEPASSGEAVGLTPRPGVAIFNPFVADGGFAECYAAVPLSDGSYVTTGYGAATVEGAPSTLGFQTTEAQDVVTFRVAAGGLDTSWGNNGLQAIQSEGAGQPTAEDRGRMALALPGDRTVQVGRYGGVPAAFVLDASGQLDAGVSDDGIIELPHDSVDSQFFGAALSDDGSRIALTTNANVAGARLVVLDVQS